jgi:hypothetical protein
MNRLKNNPYSYHLGYLSILLIILNLLFFLLPARTMQLATAISSLFIIALHALTVGKKTNSPDHQIIKSRDKKILEEKIEESFKYIGQLNVMVDQIHSLFGDLKAYPENEKEFKFILDFMAGKFLGIIDSDWVSISILDQSKLEICEHYEKIRGKVDKKNILITSLSAENLIEKNIPDEHTLIWSWSGKNNSRPKVFCLIPRENLTKEQRIFTKAIANQLELFYIIYLDIKNKPKKSFDDAWSSNK